MGGVEDELPLALKEEHAEGEVAAEERDEEGDGQRFEEPGGLMTSVGEAGVGRRLAGFGVGRGMDFGMVSILCVLQEL